MSGVSNAFSIVTGRTVSRLIEDDMEGCVAIVRAAYLAHAHGQTVNPSSVFLRFPNQPNARIIALPAYLDDPYPVSGMKWIASYPDNVRQGKPRASAVLILNDANSGYPFACLEASVISAARTAASAALAANALSACPGRARSLAIVGAGFVARHIYRFLLATGWSIEHVRVYDINAADAHRFAARVCVRERHASVITTADLGSAVGPSDLIVFATVAPRPHVFDRALFAHRPLVLHISLRDLSAQLIIDAVNVVDDIEHVMQAATSAHLAEQLTGTRAFVAGTLADVIEGRRAIDHTRTVVFSPFGLGVLDVAVGKWVYDRAITADEAVRIDDFFGDVIR